MILAYFTYRSKFNQMLQMHYSFTVVLRKQAVVLPSDHSN